MMTECPRCQGGKTRPLFTSRCLECKGAGEVTQEQATHYLDLQKAEDEREKKLIDRLTKEAKETT